MKSKKCILAAAALILAVFFAACAKPPTEEMDKATEAVIRAENDNNAVMYAGSSVARARSELEQMIAEAASKRYDTAKSHAAEAIAAAERAIAEGRAGAARAKNEAAALVAQLPPLVAETEQGLNAAHAAGLPLDFNSLNGEFNTAKTNADQAQTALGADRYQEAIDRGRLARAGLIDINQQLSNIAIASSRKK